MTPARFFAFAGCMLIVGVPATAQHVIEHQVVPSVADPAVKQFDDPSIAWVSTAAAGDAPLALFLAGTGGKPNDKAPLPAVIAGQGYRVLWLTYNDVPAVVQVCTQSPDPGCAASFREMRLTGTGKGAPGVSNPSAEGIVERLVAALRALNGAAPGEHWDQYLDGGAPRWDHIVVSGQSQGAGMAAFIAKQHVVRRVVLFSSPWETGPDRRPAPWIAQPSATPMARWYAAYNAREKTVPLIRAAYAELRVPANHIHVFDLDLPAGMPANGPNPYHPIGIRDTRYAPQWRAMYGTGSDPAP